MLDEARRRARFGVTLTDETIRRHYLQLDFTCFLALGAFVRGRLEAAIELYALDNNWARVEICAIGLPGALRRWSVGLTSEAINRAKRRGCCEIL